MNKQKQLRGMAQHRINEIRAKAARQLAANPGEVGEEAPGLEETFERAAEPAPGLSFRIRRFTPEEQAEHLNAPETKAAAVVVNASDRLANAILNERERRHGKSTRKPTRFDDITDRLADALKAARTR